MDTSEKIMLGVIAVLLVMVGFNAYNISTLTSPVTGNVIAPMPEKTQVQKSVDVVPKGTPSIYGKELGVNYDDVSAATPEKADATIKKLGAFDDQVTLSGKDMDRFISIAGRISCEYCCGADSIITKDGKAACGCAHSYAMRGLAKYLLKNHPKEFTDDQILEELGKWKTLFFPGALSKKAAVLQEKGIELNYINLASNKYRGIERGTGNAGGMVGGC
ncbi:hypothetical protein HY639_03500 [Candidatus Woesearchaeota archaeon]|nr:hypothetical protein [Candidatus Woesearchaeota archaeon]